MRLLTNNRLYLDKKLSYRRGTTRRVVSVEIVQVVSALLRGNWQDASHGPSATAELLVLRSLGFSLTSQT